MLRIKTYRVLCGFFITVAALFFNQINLLAGEVEFSPLPSWVDPVPVRKNVDTPNTQISQGNYFLLSDNQTLVDEHATIFFYHFAQKALNENGTESIGQIQINFDPSYQYLTIHQINVIRGAKIIDISNKASIKLIQKEDMLEYRLYDGSKTAYIILEDIRTGDIVEYSYTLKGSNPVFDGRYFDGISLQWSQPVHSVRSRLLWPKDRKLFVKNHNTAVQPTINHKDLFDEYIWEQERIPALIVDSNLPIFFDPYPWIQLSEFRDWNDVINWALPLYKIPDETSPDLKKVISKIATLTTNKEERLLAALEFVQDEIRYLGLEVGAGSYAPNQPATILKRRFGDCKDKAMLFTTLLSELGIKSCPALVNTRYKRIISKWHASPLAFDHVITRVTLKDEHYWIDPTRQGQKGTLETLSKPDYEMALAIDPNEKNLISMKPPQYGFFREIEDVFDLRKGTGAVAGYELKTTYYALYADLMRRSLMNKSREKMQKDYLNYLARYYPSIEINKPLEVVDLAGENKVIVTEYYTIPGFWQEYEDQKEDFRATFYPVDFYSYTEIPETTVRTMPLHIDNRTHIIQKTSILFSEEWPIENSTVKIDDPAFFFERDITYSDKTLELKYIFRTETDHVPSEDMEAYVKNLRLMDDELGYCIFDRKSLETAAQQPNWLILLLGGICTFLFVSAAVFVYRYEPTSPPEIIDPVDSKLTGLGGWLIVVAIGLVGNFFKLISSFGETLPSYAVDQWEALTNSAYSTYHVLYAPTLLFELVANLFMLVFSFLLIIMFFQKRRTFPVLYIIMAFTSLIIHITDYTLANFISPAKADLYGVEAAQLARMGFFTIVWISYFMISKRVKATFSCQRRKDEPQVKDHSDPTIFGKDPAINTQAY